MSSDVGNKLMVFSHIKLVFIYNCGQDNTIFHQILRIYKFMSRNIQEIK